MDKRYQVFISSTYADLKDERQAVIKTVIEANCIPAGMELFPAADQQQLDFIKRVIDDCDYYILIIGGRYGSVSANGLSYTEQEYDYAMSKGTPVIALIHENPDEILFGKSEKEPQLRKKLHQFREKVKANRIVKFWKNAAELPGIVAVSLHSEIHRAPGTGWVRANLLEDQYHLQISMGELQGENRAIKKVFDDVVLQNKVLRARLDELERAPVFPDLAGLDEHIQIRGTYVGGRGERRSWPVDLTWREIFGYIAPYFTGASERGCGDVLLPADANEEAKAGSRTLTARICKSTVIDIWRSRFRALTRSLSNRFSLSAGMPLIVQYSLSLILMGLAV